ncbi:alanine racemase [Listeria aquatica]|uniref:alanine racemase n=1 Tax=Listeria aquatica TaxID=1494960 RepID=UPI003F6E856D
MSELRTYTGVHRPTWIEVDLKAIQANIQNEQQLLPEGTEIFAVVKANAYGHGILEVAKAAEQAGATGFCVAILDEALYLREAGFTCPILVLGAIFKEDVALAAEQEISITVYNEEFFEGLSLPDKPLKVHVKVDTGMGRLGFQTEKEVLYAIEQIEADPRFEFEGIYTHFATADQKETSYFETQLQKFRSTLLRLSRKPRYVHAANSATALLHTQADFNMIRLGIAMYGLPPSVEIEDILPYTLQPALSLYTQIAQVKKLQPGDHVSYGATYEADQEEWVATLPIGYADGILRRFSGYEVLVDGRPTEIIGRVCMDQIIIRLDRYYPVGTVVTIIGRSGRLKRTATDAAEYLGTINYEITCALSARVPRKYVD